MKDELLDIVFSKLPTQKKKIEGFFQEIPKMEQDLELFLKTYENFFKREGITAKKLAEAYLQMLEQMMFCRKEFIYSGKYFVSNQENAFKNVYDNEEIMTNYMLALALSQFVWKHHYLVFNFYQDVIKGLNTKDSILEVGSGHGLFLLEILKSMDRNKIIDVVDISKSSIKMTGDIISAINKDFIEDIQFFTADINDYKTDKKYDFITMGEVIEHVDDPLTILKSLHTLLSENGKLFVTTCANCPALDHVYLFNNIEEIRALVEEAGFKTDRELIVPSEDKSEKYMKKFKVDIIYAAVLKKK